MKHFKGNPGPHLVVVPKTTIQNWAREFEVTSAYFLPEIEINIHVGLAEMQRKWYRSVLEKDIDAVNGLTGRKEGKARSEERRVGKECW